MEIRDQPEQNEIRSVTVTHQFNANIVRGKKTEKVGGKTMINSVSKAVKWTLRLNSLLVTFPPIFDTTI